MSGFEPFFYERARVSPLSLNDRYKTVGTIFSNSAFTETLSLSLFKSGCNIARNAQCIGQLRAPSRLLANALSIASDIASGFEQTQRQSFSRSRAGEDGTDHLACARVAGGFLSGHWAQSVFYERARV